MKSKWIVEEDNEFMNRPTYSYICPRCGGYQDESTNFCPDCGERLKHIERKRSDNMSIESTQFITRDEAIDKILYYLSQKHGTDYTRFSNDELDELLHSLKYELDLDRYENYIIIED